MTIHVIAVSAEWCGKCKDAKKVLANYDIDWIDIDKDARAQKLVEEFDIEHIPFFIIGEDNTLEVTTSRSYKQVEKLLEKI